MIKTTISGECDRCGRKFRFTVKPGKEVSIQMQEAEMFRIDSGRKPGDPGWICGKCRVAFESHVEFHIDEVYKAFWNNKGLSEIIYK